MLRFAGGEVVSAAQVTWEDIVRGYSNTCHSLDVWKNCTILESSNDGMIGWMDGWMFAHRRGTSSWILNWLLIVHAIGRLILLNTLYFQSSLNQPNPSSCLFLQPTAVYSWRQWQCTPQYQKSATIADGFDNYFYAHNVHCLKSAVRLFYQWLIIAKRHESHVFW